MWQILWINPQVEPTYKAMTLILISQWGVERMEKSWDFSVDLSKELLEAEAQREIERITLDNTPAPIPAA